MILTEFIVLYIQLKTCASSGRGLSVLSVYI